MSLALATGQTIGGSAGTAAAVTYTMFGDEIVGTTDAYKVLAQGQLSTSAAALYTTPASTQALVKTILLANTTASPITVTLYVNGTAVTNQIATIPIPSNGEAVWGEDGWQVQDGNGRIMTTSGDARLDNAVKATVNILDYGGDNTGAASSAAALTLAIAALPNGGTVLFPPGTYNFGNTAYTVSASNITLQGASRTSTVINTTSTTADLLVITGSYVNVEDLYFQGPGTLGTPTSTAGNLINVSSGAWTRVRGCFFANGFTQLNLSGQLSNVEDTWHYYFKNTGIIVNHNSDHFIRRIVMDNATTPTGAGIDVQNAGSLLMSFCNVIHANFALNISPATGLTVPSVKATNCFFDNSTVGLRCVGAGSFLRSQFTNCWFSSMSVAGAQLQPAVGGQVDGVSFSQCDFLQNVAGTTTGIDTNAQTKKWSMVECNIAGWTTGVNLVAGAAHFPVLALNEITPIGAFGVNTTGVVVGAGTYKGLILSNNMVVNNTTNATLGAVTVAAGEGGWYKIIDNAGINPLTGAAVTTPAVPASTVAVSNATGRRVVVFLKGGTISVITLNGVANTTTASNQSIVVEPGGTIAVTYSLAFTWTWVGN